ncbi:MAG: L,D-transpeptidase family protein [bacterium]|nr:MAG: L,D-transpeptidase family protein [bacterium]
MRTVNIPFFIVIFAYLFLSGCSTMPKNGPLATRFYDSMQGDLAWSNSSWPLPRANSLVEKVMEAEEIGLRFSYYNLDEVRAILTEANARKETGGRPVSRRKLLKLDRLLTKLFLIYGGNLLYGHIDPLNLEGEGGTAPEEIDLVQTLQNAVGTDLIPESLDWLQPRHPGYSGLKSVLKYYREISDRGGWPQVPFGTDLKRSDRGPRVLALKARLLVTGDLETNSTDDLFDNPVEEAVRRFQARHGLEVTGEVDALTLSDLNMPVEARIRQIRVNLERWRWLARDFGTRYLMIDIAGFRLAVVERGREILEMPIIVGQPSWKTPTFSGTMTYLVLNPVWRIPREIVIEEFVPKILENPDYLSDMRVRILRGPEEIDPASIEWESLEEDMDFWLVQESCAENPLGRIKFMFPNDFEVYLHDTPQQELFSASFRAFSHGCVRIQKPFELMDYLLENPNQCPDKPVGIDRQTEIPEELSALLDRARQDPCFTVEEYLERDCLNWTHLSVLAALQTGLEQYLVLPEPIQVHLTYLTAWVDSGGTIHFRTDLYGYDRAIDQALNQGS